MTLQQHIKDVQSGNIDIVEKTKDVLDKIETLNAEFSPLCIITKDLAIKQAKSLQENPDKSTLPLAGVFVSVKDGILVKGVQSTASSRILKGYIPVFDATVVKRIQDAGGIIIGKAVQDEFGFGSFATNVGLGYTIPKNPHNKNHATGGSSGGCAAITKLCDQHNIPHLSLAESTGGSIECPASFCGVIGMCPTYGKVSRNGLISYANSLDKIGIMASTIQDTVLGLNCISGKDDGDSTSVETKVVTISTEKKPLKIGLIKESMTDDTRKDVKNAITNQINKLKEQDHIVEEVSLPFTFEYGIPAYYILAMSEASTNLSALCGLRYGQQDLKKDEHFSEYFKRIRSAHFGKEVKRRIMLGTFTRMAGYRDAFYIKAAKARTTVIEEYQKLFQDYDVLICPTMPFTAPSFDDISKLQPIDHYMADIMTVGPNLAGMPHASFPVKTDENSMPIGMMVIANHFEEGKVLEVGQFLEDIQK